MLSQLRATPVNPLHPTTAQCANNPDDRWTRNMQEDLKEAIDSLFKFKAHLDKLHPEVLSVIERMMAPPIYRY